MSETSTIEWTDSTWNPVRGCSKVSPGCKNCYAETFAERFRGVSGHPFEQGFDLRLVPNKLHEPLKWRKPRKIFVNSMSDLFHEGVPDDYILQICRVMVQASQHQYQVLTKRPARMRELLSRAEFEEVANASHIWWGVSVDDQKYGIPRINELRNTPVRNRMLSCEPLLEDLGRLDLRDIHWVIIGGESGGGAREMDIGWVESIVDQCHRAGIAVFVKQLGAKPIDANGPFKIVGQDGKKDRKGKSIEAWPQHLQVREFPASMSGAAIPPPPNRSKRTMSGWDMLETAFATNTKLLTGERVSKSERHQYESLMGRHRKRLTKHQREIFAFRMTMGEALIRHFDDASDDDFEIKNEIEEAWVSAVNEIVKTHPGLTTRHIGMAALNIARELIERQAS